MRQYIMNSIAIMAILLAGTACAQRSVELEGMIRLNGLPDEEVPVVSAVALQPGGQLVATAGDDHIVRLWDVRTGKLVRELGGHDDWVTTISFCRDGSRLLTGGRDHRVIIWDAATGRQLGELGSHQQAITSIVFSRENDRVAITGFQSPLKVYDLATRKLLGQLACPCTDVRATAFSDDMRFLATAGRTGKLRVWDLQNGTRIDIQAIPRRVWQVLFTPDNKLLVGGEDEIISLWNPSSGEIVSSFNYGSGKVMSLEWLDNKSFAAAGADNTIRLFSIDRPKPYAVMTGHTGSIATLDYRNQTLISGSFDTTVRVWSIKGNTSTERHDPRTRSTGLITPDAPD